MKISYNWLKRYIDIDLTPGEVSEILTNTGLEVEGLEKVQSVKGGLDGVVIGQVVACEKHPDADRLSVTKVDIGGEELLDIVCGAPNVSKGQKVPVATVGTVLYKDDQEFEIKKSKIRGCVSEGMICAEDELGLGTSHEGIMVLDQDAIPGTTGKEYFNISEDYVFEIGLTPNRTDAMSHIGVARDIVAAMAIDDKYGTVTLNIPDVSDFKVDDESLQIDITVENEKDCPRYSGITMSGLKVQESPNWLKNLLNAIGIRPINNLVDISNYVMMETGQPLHFFDVEEVKGNKVIIKNLPEGSPFITLDEVERKLSANDLMICNEKEGMCIAGVFGGAKSGVSDKTRNIFIESACFNPVSVRKTSRFHSLQTDSSFRFERGTDPNNTVYAIKRSVQLLKEIAGGKVSMKLIDKYPKVTDPAVVEVKKLNIDRLIGKKIPTELIRTILKNLDIEILEENYTRLKVLVPTYRVDVTREADVIEEILRIYGYNNVEIPVEVSSSLSYWEKPDKEKLKNELSNYLTSNGFFEIMNNSLTNARYVEFLKSFDNRNDVNILNPISQDLSVLRQTLLFGGLESVIHNINRKSPDLKLFEFGNVYRYVSENSENEDFLKRYIEKMQLALFITGSVQKETWYEDANSADFYYLKAFVDNILRRIGIDRDEVKVEEISKDEFEYGLSYSLQNTLLFELGEIKKSVLDYFDINQPVFFAFANWDNLLTASAKNIVEYRELPKFPEVRRDLALLLSKEVKYSEIEDIALKTERHVLKSVRLFDVYEGDKIGADKKSYAVSFFLQDKRKTMTDKEIDKIMNKLIRAFEHSLGAEIR